MPLRYTAASLARAGQTDSVVERLAEQLLFEGGRRTSPGERPSWQRSLPVLAEDLLEAGLGDVDVLLEYQLPLTSQRADVVLAGTHPDTGRPSYVVVERPCIRQDFGESSSPRFGSGFHRQALPAAVERERWTRPDGTTEAYERVEFRD